jgi:hypothetical protein
MFFSVNKGKAAIVDFSSGNTRSYMEALDIANEKSAVSVESIFIKDISYSQISAIDYVMKRHVVEKIYLPVPQSESAYYLCAELCELAKKHGVSAELYGAFESVEISEGISVVALQDSDALLACGESVVLYTNQSSLRDTDITKASDVIIFGTQNDASKEGSLTLGKEANVIFSSREAMENSRADFTDGRVYALDGVCCIDLNKLLN